MGKSGSIVLLESRNGDCSTINVVTWRHLYAVA